MKIVCLHGYFMFFEDKPGEIAKYNTLYGQALTAHKDGYYTFAPISELPEYSLKGKLFGSLIAKKNYSGKPWDVMRENGFVYNLVIKAMSDINTTGYYFKPVRTEKYFYTNGLVLPGSFSDDSKKVTGYNCKFDFDSLLYRYTEFYFD